LAVSILSSNVVARVRSSISRFPSVERSKLVVVSVVVVVREAMLHTTGKVGLFCIGRICGLDTVGIRSDAMVVGAGGAGCCGF
jgi:hypothetical protein